jgi:hypothetical protein
MGFSFWKKWAHVATLWGKMGSCHHIETRGSTFMWPTCIRILLAFLLQSYYRLKRQEHEPGNITLCGVPNFSALQVLNHARWSWCCKQCWAGNLFDFLWTNCWFQLFPNSYKPPTRFVVYLEELVGHFWHFWKIKRLHLQAFCFLKCLYIYTYIYKFSSWDNSHF